MERNNGTPPAAPAPPAPPPRIVLGQKFYTQKQLEEAKQVYEWEQGVPFIVGNSQKRETYNNSADPSKHIPVGITWKEVTMTCKHFGKPRQSKHVPGRKKRPNQNTFKRGCEAKFNVCFSVDEGCYTVTKIQEEHKNHALDKKDLAKNYPEFRRPSTGTVKEVEGLFNYEVKAHKIKNVVLNSGIKATSQDIQNLRNKWKSKLDGSDGKSDMEAVFDELQRLQDEDPNSIVAVTFDPETFEVQSLFFQTSEMRVALETYPEVLITDMTYKLSVNNMPLAVYQVIDSNGAGRIVGYALLVSEKKEVVSGALELLKLGHGDLVNKIEVVLIDKDPSEIAAITVNLPNAAIHLCDYHVKEVFKKSSVRRLTDKNWEEVDPLIKRLIHAFSREEYDEAYSELENLVGKDGNFMKYFNKNWHNSPLIWTEYKRNLSFTMGERTTGRTEVHNAKIKEVVDKRLPVAEVVKRLRLIGKLRSVEFERKAFNATVKTRYHKYSNDPVIQKMFEINTPFVSDLLKRQYERSLEQPSRNPHDVSCTKCDCAFFTKFKLLCSHIFRERRMKGVEIYDHTLVPKRWTVIIGDDGTEPKEKESSVDILMAPVKAPKKKKALTSEDRYNLSESICSNISSLIANLGGEQFEQAINALSNMLDLLKLGKQVAVIGINNEVGGGTEALKKVSNIVTAAVKTNDEDIQEDIPSEKTVPGLVPLSDLDPDIRSQLKLPPKQVIRGNPKGKRKATKKVGLSNTQPSCDDSDESALDDPAVHSQCPGCEGPVVCRTSFTKQNYGRKFLVCANPVHNQQCKHYHQWITLPNPIKSTDIRKDGNLVEANIEYIGFSHGGLTDNINFEEVEDTAFLILCPPSATSEPNVETADPGTSDSSVETSDPVLGKNGDDDERETPYLPNEMEAMKFEEKGTSDHEKSTDLSRLLVENEDFFKTFLDTKEDSNPASTKSDLCDVIHNVEDILNTLDSADKSNAITSDKNYSTPDKKYSTPDKKYKCFTCNNENVEKRKIITPGPDYGREYYGCFATECTRKKPFLFWISKKQRQPQLITKDISSFISGSDRNSEQGDKLCHCKEPAKRYIPLFPSSNTVPSYRCAKNRCTFSSPVKPPQVPADENKSIELKRCCFCGIVVSGDTFCSECGKSIHPIAPCSVPTPNSDKSAGVNVNKRCCRACNGSSTPGGVTARPVKTEGSNEKNSRFKFEFTTDFPSSLLDKIQTLESHDFFLMNHKITKGDLNSLKPGKWLNDKIIDAFVDLMCGPNKLQEKDASILKLHSLALENASMGVHTIIDRANTEFMLFNDLWLIPTHVNRNHWVLLIVLVKRKLVLLLDPMGHSPTADVVKQLQILRYMIYMSHMQCFGVQLNWDEWRICAPSDISTQSNGSDCGIFVCIWIRSICSKSEIPPNICQNSVAIRSGILKELLSNAVSKPKENPQSSTDDDREFIEEVYSDFDTNMDKGHIIIKKPWEELPAPSLSKLPDDLLSAGHLLPDLLNTLWRATEAECGATKCKNVSKDMYLCEGCREFFHLECIHDNRKRPNTEEHYLCPLHTPSPDKLRSVGKRTIRLPLRLRKSLS